jgi:hypothetical protein
MKTIEVKPAGPDRTVPMPGKRRQYFPHDVWTPFPESFELWRLITGGDLVLNTAAPAAAQEG